MQESESAGVQDSEEDAVKGPSSGTGGSLKKWLLSLLLVGLLTAVAAGLTLAWLDSSLSQPQTYSGQVFQINKGDSLKGFSTRLKQAGIINQTYSFVLYARYKGLTGKLHTGQYQFPDGMNLKQVLDAITSGKNRLSYRFTFVQGSNFRQMRESLAASITVNQTLGDKSDTQVLALFDPARQYTHPEGLFFPDTYAYDAGASDQDILRRAYTAMQDTLRELWAERDPHDEIDTPYKALILASIIEKETALASERNKISGVFINRLRKGIKLQTDPTVIYGLGDSYKGNIKRKHLTTDTPYNTYTRYGLPPTPISMPGRAAIEAALHPEDTAAIYFVARGDGSGGHRFSKTLSEHNRAVKQYLKARRKS